MLNRILTGLLAIVALIAAALGWQGARNKSKATEAQRAADREATRAEIAEKGAEARRRVEDAVHETEKRHRQEDIDAQAADPDDRSYLDRPW